MGAVFLRSLRSVQMTRWGGRGLAAQTAASTARSPSAGRDPRRSVAVPRAFDIGTGWRPEYNYCDCFSVVEQHIGELDLDMRSIPLLFALAVLTACASIEAVPPDPNLGPENAAHVTVYRPTSDRLGSAVEFRAYAGKTILGVLERGGAVRGLVEPGPTTIHVRVYLLGMRYWQSTELELDLRAGEPYYLRYSQHVDSLVPLPSGPVMTVGTQLRRVSEAAYKNRE